MDIKFILLVIGIFIFTLGYVNQNKYNCNVIPSLDRIQEKDLKNLFNRDSSFMNYNRDLNYFGNTNDKDIVTNANIFAPAYIVFENYDIILKWNRSLRFALAVCTLKDKIKNEL